MRTPPPTESTAEDGRTALASALPPFSTLPEEARSGTRLLRLPALSPLFHAGARPVAMYCVLAGEVRLVRTSRGGGEVILQRATRGPIAEASLDQPAYHCDAVAARPAAVLAIPRPAVVAALAHEPFRTAWIAHLARELRRVRAQSERLALRSARERILHYVETEGRDGEVLLAGSLKDWAGELGLTHEALYRTLAALRRSGSLAIDGRRLVLG
jgi:CRP-like cAMP-binding protein